MAVIAGAFIALVREGTFVFQRSPASHTALDASLVDVSESSPAVILSKKTSITDTSFSNRCRSESVLYLPEDTRFCANIPKLDRFRLFEINLSQNRILFYEQGILERTFPIAYQAAYGRWFQTPTGYFRMGAKKPKFKSSIVPVYMEHAVQLYEDFFVHGIPYYEDGTRVTSQFSGGCIRLEDGVAESFYATARQGDDVVSYVTLEGYLPKQGVASPVDQDSFWIRQRFNSPLKVDWTWRKETDENYIQHTAVDFAPLPNVSRPTAHAVADGIVQQIIINGSHDRGLGNTVLIAHRIDGVDMYGLYAHLDHIDEGLVVGGRVHAGDVVGLIGNTGYGCAYWHVGDDGCAATGEADTHLHFELKTKPVLDAPISDPTCAISKDIHSCVGSTSADPILFGYLDPMEVLFTAEDK